MQLFLQTVVHDYEKRKNYFSNRKVLILCTLGRHNFQKVLCALVWKKKCRGRHKTDRKTLCKYSRFGSRCLLYGSAAWKNLSLGRKIDLHKLKSPHKFLFWRWNLAHWIPNIRTNRGWKHFILGSEMKWERKGIKEKKDINFKTTV